MVRPCLARPRCGTSEIEGPAADMAALTERAGRMKRRAAKLQLKRERQLRLEAQEAERLRVRGASHWTLGPCRGSRQPQAREERLTARPARPEGPAQAGGDAAAKGDQ